MLAAPEMAGYGTMCYTVQGEIGENRGREQRYASAAGAKEALERATRIATARTGASAETSSSAGSARATLAWLAEEARDRIEAARRDALERWRRTKGDG